MARLALGEIAVVVVEISNERAVVERRPVGRRLTAADQRAGAAWSRIPRPGRARAARARRRSHRSRSPTSRARGSSTDRGRPPTDRRTKRARRTQPAARPASCSRFTGNARLGQWCVCTPPPHVCRHWPVGSWKSRDPPFSSGRRTTRREPHQTRVMTMTSRDNHPIASNRWTIVRPRLNT